MPANDHTALPTLRILSRTYLDAAEPPGVQCPPEAGEGRSVEIDVVLGCLKKVYRWSVPRHWSERDWFEEIRAELAVAAMEAERDFDPARGVPWTRFLGRRLMYAALAQYRREWSVALHQVSLEAMGNLGPAGDEPPHRDTQARLIHEALRRLPRADAMLIEGLFWGGASEADLARSLGISQQAVNKRKYNIFKALHRMIDALAENYEQFWL
jgi:DNA-directed RNA polymerase specialized sigma24 family protein